MTLLAEKGSHLDCMRNEIFSAIDVLDSVSLPRYSENLSLRCQVAEVIVNAGIPYTQYLPFLLVKFVELHI